MVTETGCDAVMVGRGSFGNPWLFGRAQRLLDGLDPGPEPTPRERISTAIAHLHDLARKKGDYSAVLMRKHVAWYVRGLYDNSTLCRKINHAQNPAETEALLLEYLDMLERAPEPVLAGAANGHDGAEADGNGSGESS
jgi:tRNA-dihydrouridine synthase B